MHNYSHKVLTIGLLLFSVLASSNTLAHCQIPCGIYDDHAKVKEMLQDAQTIEKATNLIIELADKTDPLSKNQLVRWVMNKELHAENIISTISGYYLTQRVKSNQKDYAQRLIKHHTVMIAAMKTKQNVDAKYAKDLVAAIEAIAPYYPEHEH